MKESFKTNLKGKTEVLQLLNSYQNALEDERRYHYILDNLTEGFQLIGFDWRYLYVNNTVVKQSKFTREEFLERTMMEMYPGIEETDMFKTLSLCMNARIFKRFEHEFKYSDNSTDWFELSVQPVQEGIVILYTNITNRKKAESKNRHYTEGMEKMLRLASHKIRQPVAHILGLTNILKDSAHSPDELAKIIDYLRESADALDVFTKDLTNDLQKLQKKEKNGTGDSLH